MNSPRLLILAICISLASCSPWAAPRLIPTGSNAESMDGRQYMFGRADGLQVAIAFDGVEDDLLVFEVIVGNELDRPVTVSPERFHCVPILSLQDTSGVGSSRRVISAIDPEAKIAETDRRIERKRNSHTKQSIVSEVLSVLVFFIKLGSLFKEDTPEEQEYEEQRQGLVEDLQLEKDIAIENDLMELMAVRERWADWSLRRKTLEGGETARGLVHFPAKVKTRFVKVFVVAGEVSQGFVFRQNRGRR